MSIRGQVHYHQRERLRCLQILGLNEDASEDDIRKAYKKAALVHHPDKNQGQDTTQKFQEIQTAYKYLQEGDSYLAEAMEHQEDTDFIIILQHLFPWIFKTTSDPFSGFPHGQRQWHQTSFHRTTSAQNTQPNPYFRDDYYQNYNFYNQERGSQRNSGTRYGNQSQYTNAGATGYTSQQQPTQEKPKSAKKQQKDFKRSAHLANDREQNEAQQTRTSSRSYTSTPSGGDSGTSTPRQNRSTSRESSPKKKSPSQAETPSQPQKLTKKQIHNIEKKREKEKMELREDLERFQKEQQEKTERKERKEREAREAEERRREEEEARRVEEMRKQQELERARREEERKMHELMKEFDDSCYVDDRGQFKSSGRTLAQGIYRDDLHNLDGSNAEAMTNTKAPSEANINGLTPKELFELQNGGTSNETDSSEHSHPMPGYQAPQNSPTWKRFGNTAFYNSNYHNTPWNNSPSIDPYQNLRWADSANTTVSPNDPWGPDTSFSQPPPTYAYTAPPPSFHVPPPQVFTQAAFVTQSFGMFIPNLASSSQSQPPPPLSFTVRPPPRVYPENHLRNVFMPSAPSQPQFYHQQHV